MKRKVEEALGSGPAVVTKGFKAFEHIPEELQKIGIIFETATREKVFLGIKSGILYILNIITQLIRLKKNKQICLNTRTLPKNGATNIYQHFKKK